MDHKVTTGVELSPGGLEPVGAWQDTSETHMKVTFTVSVLPTHMHAPTCLLIVIYTQTQSHVESQWWRTRVEWQSSQKPKLSMTECGHHTDG